MRIEQVLPDGQRLRCDEIRITDENIIIVVSSTLPVAHCPICDQPSARIHSRYVRTLADLPWHGSQVTLCWNSRRFYCQNGCCSRRIFTERLPEVAAPYARKTQRMKLILSYLGFACGGEGGARLSHRLGMPTSPDTLLRTIRRRPFPDRPTPRILGVDDWSFRRGQRYGTILCDLESHQPVALLPERSAETFAAWLQQHPGVEVISRDRGDPYIKGATAGAPDAVQVADRFHLVRNLRDALSRLIDRHSTQVLATVRTVNERNRNSTPPKPQLTVGDENSPPVVDVTRAEQLAQQHRTQRLQRYEEVMDLRQQNISHREIARRLGLDRGTVRRFVRAGTFPERASRSYRRGADAFRVYLERRWQEGCKNAMQLTRELQGQGFRASYYTVRRYVAHWRDGPAANRSAGKSGSSLRKPSSHRIVAWLLKPEAQRTDEEQTFRDVLVEQCPQLKAAAEVCREFEVLLRDRQFQLLDQWLAKATDAHIAQELRRFAEGLHDDIAAVRAAFTLPWSNGQVEGQVNRLKLIKRQMYGRAKFDLLQSRVLFAS